MHFQIREILGLVRNPFRYVGGEVGSLVKDWDGADVRVCLAFPDVYEIGMSHLGLSILYHIINSEPRMMAERVFTPWLDMEKELEKRGVPLFSLESHRPLSDFDIVGFSLAYELTYTNILTMLKLSEIPRRASDRSETHPIIIAGGPCTFNPTPIAPFFDAIVIGDGEGAIVEITNAVSGRKRGGDNRDELLESLSRIRGVYVPAVHGERLGAHKAHVSDLDLAPFPHAPIVPHAATQERVAVEVSRGCARGCRFCQAGYIYRPVRQREATTAVKIACDGIASTGADEFSFLSLSIGDWAPLETALECVHENVGGLPVNASLPSLRAESLSTGIVANLGRARAGSFTLAPETSTERMRKLINKGNTDDDLFASVEKIFQNGWHAIKLYFMIGLPQETDAEIDGIVKIANRCLDIGRRHHRRPEVTVSTSTFVPKPHTPFQWERQISMEETGRIQDILKKKLRRPGLYYRWHDAGMSFLEGVFSRGGSELSRAIEIAHEKGARFDGWDENFNLERWMSALKEAGIDPNDYHRARDENAVLPWDFLGVGPSREFLLRERARALALEFTEDCIMGKCTACGICDFKEIKNRIASNPSTSPLGKLGASLGAGEQRAAARYRLRYRKTGCSAFLGPIETLDALRRSFRSAGLSICYTEGYHPRAKVSSGLALPAGIESEAEFVDVTLGEKMDGGEIVRKLAGRLPEGLEVVEAAELPDGAESIEAGQKAARYEVSWESGLKSSEVKKRFEESSDIVIKRVRGEKETEVNLKDYVDELAVFDNSVLGISVRNRQPALKISEILCGLFGIKEEIVRVMRIKKVSVVFT